MSRPYAVRRFAAGLAGGFRPLACRGRLSACGHPSLSARAEYSSRSMPVYVYHIIPRVSMSVQYAKPPNCMFAVRLAWCPPRLAIAWPPLPRHVAGLWLQRHVA